MKLVAHKSFKRTFKKLIKKNPQLQNKVLGILDLLENDPFTLSFKIDNMQYRRARLPGSTYFSTVVTHNRRAILCETENIELLRDSFRRVIKQHSFVINAIVILPNHLHCIWTLPKDDADYSTRWRLVKSCFSRRFSLKYQGQVSDSRQSKGEKAIWQRQFWEHLIRDEQNFINHVDYIHYNPVPHSLVLSPKDWQYSSFHRYVQRGVYDVSWGSSEIPVFVSLVGME